MHESSLNHHIYSNRYPRLVKRAFDRHIHTIHKISFSICIFGMRVSEYRSIGTDSAITSNLDQFTKFVLNFTSYTVSTNTSPNRKILDSSEAVYPFICNTIEWSITVVVIIECGDGIAAWSSLRNFRGEKCQLGYRRLTNNHFSNNFRWKPLMRWMATNVGRARLNNRLTDLMAVSHLSMRCSFQFHLFGLIEVEHRSND